MAATPPGMHNSSAADALPKGPALVGTRPKERTKEPEKKRKKEKGGEGGAVFLVRRRV